MSPAPQYSNGIEALLQKAATDDAFRALLLEKRGASAREIGMELVPAEHAMLAAIKREQLERAIEQRASVSHPAPPAPLKTGDSCLVQTFVVVATVAALSSISVGSRPDRPPRTPRAIDRDRQAYEAPAEQTKMPPPALGAADENTTAALHQASTTSTAARLDDATTSRGKE